MSAVTSTLECILQEFATATANGTACVVNAHVIPRPDRDNLAVMLTGVLAYPPTAATEFVIPGTAIAHARDAGEFLKAITEEHFKPFGAKLTRAASAAQLGWAREIEL